MTAGICLAFPATDAGPAMIGSLLLRGMLVGVIAGLLAFGFARIVGEPQVDRAIAFEQQMRQAAGEAPEPELVSRATQAGLGLFTGVVIYGAAIGGLFSLVFAFVYGRIGPLDARAIAALLSISGFIAVVLVPALKYPPNPPSIGNPDTIGFRTAWYFAMLLISIVTLVLGVLLARGLTTAYGAWNACVLAALAYIAVIVIAYYLLPVVDEVPRGFSATLLWQFRMASLGIQAVLWTTLGLAFGALTTHSLNPGKMRHLASPRG